VDAAETWQAAASARYATKRKRPEMHFIWETHKPTIPAWLWCPAAL
jgi:hypothetical protein